VLNPILERKEAMANTKGTITAGIGWMLTISILLFWLPVLGPFVAGFVGGKKSGGVVNALVAVFAPALVVAVTLFVIATMLTDAPLIGAVASAGGVVLFVADIGPLLVGAIIGGAFAD